MLVINFTSFQWSCFNDEPGIDSEPAGQRDAKAQLFLCFISMARSSTYFFLLFISLQSKKDTHGTWQNMFYWAKHPKWLPGSTNFRQVALKEKDQP